jgi:aspartate racemase
LKRLGILGGMGPAAAIDLQQKILSLTPAESDQDHLPVVVWNIPQIPERTPAIQGHGDSPLPEMVKGIQALSAMGAQVIVIACNTAHHWYEALQAASSVPLLHIADAVHEALTEASTEPMTQVGLMATPGTILSGFYAQRLQGVGVSVLLPDAAEQESLTRAILLIKAGRIDQAATLVDQVATALINRGAQRLIMGCTELPLVLSKIRRSDLVVDATLELARQAVMVCRQLQAPSTRASTV